MLPDLRFAIGAMLATALLGVTAFGLIAAVHIAHQSKVSPLEASRLLAYTPEAARRGETLVTSDGGPFARIPAGASGAGTPPPAERVAANDVPQPAAVPTPDPDAVDERAVVDPPLPLDTEPQPSADMPSDPVPVPAATPVETAPAAPAPPAATATVPPAGEVEQVGSVPPQAEPAAPIPAVAPLPAPRKAAQKKAAPKIAAKPRPRATRARAGTLAPSASSGYPVSNWPDAPVSRGATAARGDNSPLWLGSD